MAVIREYSQQKKKHKIACIVILFNGNANFGCESVLFKLGLLYSKLETPGVSCCLLQDFHYTGLIFYEFSSCALLLYVKIKSISTFQYTKYYRNKIIQVSFFYASLCYLVGSPEELMAEFNIQSLKRASPWSRVHIPPGNGFVLAFVPLITWPHKLPFRQSLSSAFNLIRPTK